MALTREIFEEILDSGHPLICRFEPGFKVGQLPDVDKKFYEDCVAKEVVYVIFYMKNGRISRTIECKEGDRVVNFNGYYTGQYSSMFEVVQMARRIEVRTVLMAVHLNQQYERSASILILQQKLDPDLSDGCKEDCKKVSEENINKLRALIRAEKALYF